MNTQRGGSKKRKGESLEAEKSLYSTFTAAANSVSQLYTAAVQQTKRAEEQGARQALERVAQFVVKEYGNAPAVPTGVLMEVLRQELQAAQCGTTAIQLPFPVPLLPTGGGLGSESSDAHHSDDEHLMSADQSGPAAGFRRCSSGHHISPPKVRGSSAVAQLPALFQQQQMQQQQQQQQQQLAAAQHHQLMMQQHQQQQHAAAAAAGFMHGFTGQQPFQ
ncbi:hypothetical protein CHLNCDRAFT_133329 [Chlorella variabilis]|uniref:Uncharacterized protein n=1 Tax=Chlorella variabilis TaxID=554065 RepID=E1Z2V8_CHLVA|nr:hypothetical protein CHLNCDRAFT_133329 [Chlorella variabilis]EFN59734.1 hypothetical protein CHLNCDRAFT_133329 [Chlorella variabilis]|eukprot:XP_005851836.1 hypothetical protein CHLNCDRAFT_133329 [Chlorella variabilis]